MDNTSPTNQYSGSTTHTEDEIDLLALLGALLDQKWTVISSTVSIAALAIIYAVLATPVYQAGALLQVEEKAASLPGLEDLSEAFGSESSTQAELEILKSRSVVGTAVTNLNLTVQAEPKLFPAIGHFVYRRFNTSEAQPLASAFLGLEGYAWGGEQIEVDRFEVRDSMLGETFTLTAGRAETYTLENPDFGIKLTGKVGETLKTGDLEIFVS